MKSAAATLLTIFALLTDPYGQNVWIAKSGVIAVKAPAKGECEHDARAKVYTQTLAFCVAEDPEDAANKIAGQ